MLLDETDRLLHRQNKANGLMSHCERSKMHVCYFVPLVLGFPEVGSYLAQLYIFVRTLNPSSKNAVLQGMMSNDFVD